MSVSFHSYKMAECVPPAGGPGFCMTWPIQLYFCSSKHVPGYYHIHAFEFWHNMPAEVKTRELGKILGNGLLSCRPVSMVPCGGWCHCTAHSVDMVAAVKYKRSQLSNIKITLGHVMDVIEQWFSNWNRVPGGLQMDPYRFIWFHFTLSIKLLWNICIT